MRWYQSVALILASFVAIDMTADPVFAEKPIKQRSHDRMFVMEAARGGMAEVSLGRLAARKGSTEEVRPPCANTFAWHEE